MFKTNKIVYGYAIALGFTFLGTSAGLLVGNNYHQDALQKMLGAVEDRKFLNTLQVDILYNRPAKQLSPYLADPDGFKRESGKFLDRIQKISTALEAYNSSGKTSNIEGLQPLLAEYEMVVKKFQQEAKLEIAQLTSLTESPKTLTTAELRVVKLVKSKDFVKFIEFPDRLLPFAQLADLQTTKAESALTYSKTIRNSIVAGSVLLSAVISGLFAIFASRAIAREQVAINQQLRDQLTEREQAEAQLRESEQRYVNLNDAAPVGIFRTDADGNSIYINQRCCEMIGLPPEATTEKSWQQALHPDDREYVIAEQIRTRRENLPFQLEYRILRPNGSVIWVLGNAVVEQDANGQIIGYVGTITDISDRKRSEEALQKNETHSRALISAMPDIIFRMNQEGVYLEFLASPNFNVLGDLSKMVGTNVLDILPPQASQRRMKSVQKVLQTGSIQVYEQELYIDGIPQIEEVRIVPYSETEVLGLVRNISDRKQAELALAKSEAQSRAILSAIPDLMFRVGTDGVYREVITQQQDFAFFPLDFNLIGRSMTEVLPAELADRQFHYLRKAIETGKLQIYEQNIQIGDRFQDEEVRVIKSSEDEVLFMIRDISDRKQSEIALQNLIAGTATTTGQDFFPALVSHIAKALNVSHALVTELVDDELHSLAFWGNGLLQPTFSFNIAKTPCEKTLQQGQFYCDSFVQQMFPQDLALVDMNAYSYLGISLKDSNGQAIGNLCILDKQTIPNPQRAEQVLRVFAARATAELERQRANTMLVQLNQELESKVQKRTMELQKLSERLTLSLRSGAIGCWEWHIDPPHVIWDERMYELFGTKEKVDPRMGYQTWANGLHPEDRAATEALALQAILGEIEFDTEFRVVHTDRTIHFIKAYGTLLRDSEGNPQSLIGINFDISDRKQAENAILESQKFLQTVLDTFPLSVFWKDRNSVYLGCNRNFLKDAGLDSVADIIGKTDYEMPWGQTEADSYRQYDRQVIDNDEAKLGIIESQLPASGNQIWLETNKLPLYNLKGEVIGILGTYQDITERKQAEEQLQHTNQELLRATRLKDEFLANMSHELRTPLNAILGMAEGLQEQVYGSINDRQLKALQTVENSGNHLLELINDILNLAKIEAGQVELNYSSTSINCLCESSLNFIRQQAMKKQIQLDIHLQPNLPEMQLDERRIKQVLINILNNAVKFTATGGRIKLEATKLSHVSEQPQKQTQDYLQISITDTGIGISPENIQRLFKPFIQIDSALNRKYEGTGLGLALVKQIVELHGGTVGITSELGIGSCFTIELPINHLEPPLTPEPRSESNLEPHLEPRQTSVSTAPLILLAEDNEANIITVTSYLEAKAYRLLIAMNGQEAIALAKNAQPDLILMDIQMPFMDGLEAIKQIRLDPNLADIPIIALTALAMAGDRQKCIDAGANEYIAKPIKLKALSQMIQSFLDF
ncbi:circadian input kinase A [Pseudanabaena sp. lw0831]|uniref:PAS domain S-box protein n=1 Tax=Pseudanabaena sp. lw0831 TaxID=1357935 RepID=UPI001915CBC7|nr:PAS domain S-box protein [Pseudanabaena sp. lw0831]GBO52344.1 circadian input kinase A [Pseudanabaena sp. lw0831]